MLNGGVVWGVVPMDWIIAVKEAIFETPRHIYQVLTKNPGNGFFKFNWTSNVWRGVTVTNQNEIDRVSNLVNHDTDINGLRFVSFEPLLGPIDLSAVAGGIDWVIIGRMTGPGSSKYICDKSLFDMEWVHDIMDWCEEHAIPCFVKNNVGLGLRYQEFPKED